MKQFYLLSYAIAILALAVAASAQDDNRVAATWQVQKYDISATLPQNEADRNLTAKAKLDLKNVSPRPASSLTLRISPDAEISSVSVNGSATEFSKGEETIGGSKLQKIMIRLPAVGAGGTMSAAVDYKVNVKDNSGISSISPAGSQFLPLSFWYPTPNSWFFARGADYAPFRLQVNSGALKAVSAGAESGGAFESKLTGQPFFAAGNWEPVNAGGVMVFLPAGAGADEQKAAAEIAAFTSEARTFMTGLFGPAPDAPLRIVAAKRGGGFAGGGTILVDDGAFRRSKLDAQAAMTIADAVAKMWIGGSVALAGDGAGVLREGLTRFAATQFLEQKYGADVAEIERLRQRIAYASISRRDAPLTIVTPLDDYYYGEVTNKGAMVWRLLARKHGNAAFFKSIRAAAEDGSLSLSEVRELFPSDKATLDHLLDQITDMNLQAGLPQLQGGETKIALRNTGSVDATVEVEAIAASGERLTAPSTIRAKSFGEVIFKTAAKIDRIEIDPEKYYPQTDYSDDIAPREVADSDLLLAVKRHFDKQDFAGAEKVARIVLKDFPRFDDVRVLLARSLLGQNKLTEAQTEFNAVLAEKLPTGRSIAWANVGLGEVAARSGRVTDAVRYANAAISSDAEYGASLAARNIRKNAGTAAPIDQSVSAFFVQFDRAAASNRKTDLESLILPGEVSRFASGISGQTVEWKTSVLSTDKIDSNTMLVETTLNIKLLNRDPESGLAVYRLTRSGSNWKLSGVDIFEVR